MKRTNNPFCASDAIVDEVRAIRADISARFGNDVNRLCEHLRKIEAEFSGREVQNAKRSHTSKRHINSGKHPGRA